MSLRKKQVNKLNFGGFVFGFLQSSCDDCKLPEGDFPIPLQMFCLLFVDILLGFAFQLSVTPFDQHCTLIFSKFKDKTKKKADFSLLFATVASCHYLHQFKISGVCFKENFSSLFFRGV